MPKQKTPSYTEEFRLSAVQMALDSDETITKTAKVLGVNDKTLHNWVAKYRPRLQGPQALESQSADDVQAELKRLRKANQRLQLECEILKKATAYFAKEAT